MEFTEERDAELARAFHSLADTVSRIVPEQFFQRLVTSPSSRFWVSESRAAIVVTDIINGKSLSHMRPTKREMFYEIYRRYLALRAARPHEPLRTLIGEIIHQPAPSFYLSPSSARQYLYKLLRKKLRERKRRCQ